MAGVRSDTSDVERFSDQLHAVGIALADLEPANAEAGREVLDASRPPRRTGELASKLRADVTRNGVAFASAARYWTFAHFGAPRHHMAAQPWYPAALRVTRDRLLRVYEQHATDAFKKVT